MFDEVKGVNADEWYCPPDDVEVDVNGPTDGDDEVVLRCWGDELKATCRIGGSELLPTLGRAGMLDCFRRSGIVPISRGIGSTLNQVISWIAALS